MFLWTAVFRCINLVFLSYPFLVGLFGFFIHLLHFHCLDLFTCDSFVAILTKLVSSQPRDSSETFLLGKLVGHHAQSPVR